MQLYASGIVTDHRNDVLLIRRNDSFTWAPPGGAIERGESPPKAVVREIREETGAEVVPARLVGLYYRPEGPNGVLSFSFRCLQSGGELQPSAESPVVQFMPPEPIPSPMLGLHRRRLQQALQHPGGTPYWDRESLPASVRAVRWLVFKWLDLRRALRGAKPFGPPPDWTVGAFVVVPDEEGRVLWVRRTDHEVWNLPGGRVEAGEAPWETAVRETKEETGLDVRLTHLAGVHTKPDQEALILTFTGEITGGTLQTNQEAAAFDYFRPGEEPANTLPRHVERVSDAVSGAVNTVFREQRGARSDLAALATQA